MLANSPVIILVAPQLGENIGMVARAMLNCGHSELRLVAPRDGWPNPAAVSAASGADSVLERATVYPTTKAAIADLDFVVATCVRIRNLNIPIDNLSEGVAQLKAQAGRKCGVLFGPERTGLTTDDVALANRFLTIPLNPDFASLNLAQAVLLVAYSYWALGNPEKPPALANPDPAPAGALEGIVGHIETELDNIGFFTAPEKRPHMMRNLRAAFGRMDLTRQDVDTFRGLIKALVLGRRGA